MIDSELQERFEAIHVQIMDGDNAELQEMIDTGLAWKLEGSIGRTAMDALKAGACVLGAVAHMDYYGGGVPATNAA